MGRRHLGALVLAAGLGSATVLAACGDDPPVLDQAEAETAVEAATAEVVPVEVAAASCPADVPRAEGERFRCTVELVAVGSMPVAVRQLDDAGRLEVEPLAVVLADAEVAAQLKAELRTRFERSFLVDCGDAAHRVWEPGDTFACRARDADSRRSVEVTVLDPAGTLSFEVLRPSS